jgi:hypothetical protein
MESILGGHSGGLSGGHSNADSSPPAPLPRHDTPDTPDAPRHGTSKAFTKFTDGDAATWSEFLHFYSRGAWDPQKVPVMPKWGPHAPPLPSGSPAASQSPAFPTEGSSETIHHTPLTFGELTSSQLETCSLPRSSLCTQSVMPQGDNFESLGYLAAPFAPRMSPPESETIPFTRFARRTRPETSTLSLQCSTFYQRS